MRPEDVVRALAGWRAGWHPWRPPCRIVSQIRGTLPIVGVLQCHAVLRPDVLFGHATVLLRTGRAEALTVRVVRDSLGGWRLVECDLLSERMHRLTVTRTKEAA